MIVFLCFRNYLSKDPIELASTKSNLLCWMEECDVATLLGSAPPAAPETENCGRNKTWHGVGLLPGFHPSFSSVRRRERERERASRRLVSKATGAGSGELRSKPKTICRVSSLRWNLNPVFLSNFTEKPRLSLSRCHYRARFGTFFSPLLRF